MKTLPKHILVTVLDWGLGHATRSMVIINILLQKGFRVSIAGDGQSLELLKQEYSHLNFYELKSYDVLYSRTKPLALNLLLQLPKFLKAIRKEHQQIEHLIDTHKCDAVISDNRYGCWSKKIPSILITHQLNIQMPTYLVWLSKIVNYFNHLQIKKFSACWIPDFTNHSLTGELTKSKNLPVQFVGMLSRFTRLENQEDNKLIVGIVSGPEPQRTTFEELLVREMEQQAKECIIVRGFINGDEKVHPHITFINHLRAAQLNELIQRAGIIISRSGYSTIMDLATLGKKRVIFIPTPGQTEQEYLAEQLKTRKVAMMQTQSEFDLTKAISELKIYSGFDSIGERTNLLENAIDELIK